MKKRLLAIMLTFCMAFSLMSVSVFADGDTPETVGLTLKWSSIDGETKIEDKTIQIPIGTAPSEYSGYSDLWNEYSSVSGYLPIALTPNPIGDYSSTTDILEDSAQDKEISTDTVLFVIEGIVVDKAELVVEKPLCGTEVKPGTGQQSQDFSQENPPKVTLKDGSKLELPVEAWRAPVWWDGCDFASGQPLENTTLEGGKTYYVMMSVFPKYGYVLSSTSLEVGVENAKADTVEVLSRQILAMVCFAVDAEHVPEDPENEDVEKPTCTDAGSHNVVVYCAACSEMLSSKNIEDKATGHDWGKWKVTKEPTETRDGMQERICRNDPSHRETKALPAKGGCSISVEPKSVEWTAEAGYKGGTDEGLDADAIYQDITAVSTGTEEVEFIVAGFEEMGSYEYFGLSVGGMTATVYPNEGLGAGTYSATVIIEDWEDRFEPVKVPVTFTVTEKPSEDDTAATYSITFDLNGGTLDGKSGKVTLNAEEGSVITLPKPEKEGYTFDYWKGSRYEAGAKYTVKNDHTFTAQWKKAESRGDGKTSPKMGDGTNTAVWLMLMLAAAAAYIPAGRAYKRRK